MNNYKNKNDIPEFFMKGRYNVHHRLIAEEEFRKTANVIAKQNEIKNEQKELSTPDIL